MIFNINKFQRYKIEHENDCYPTWLESLQNNGYPSSRKPSNDEELLTPWVYEMDDNEFTLFALKYS